MMPASRTALPPKHPLAAVALAYRRAAVRACTEQLREIEGRLDQGCGSRWEQQISTCDDLQSLARLMLTLQKRTQLKGSESGWLEELAQMSAADVDDRAVELVRLIKARLGELAEAVPYGIPPAELLGAPVLRQVEGVGAFAGVVIEHEPLCGFRVRYSDGEVEDVPLRELRMMLLRRVMGETAGNGRLGGVPFASGDPVGTGLLGGVRLHGGLSVYEIYERIAERRLEEKVARARAEAAAAEAQIDEDADDEAGATSSSSANALVPGVVHQGSKGSKSKAGGKGRDGAGGSGAKEAPSKGGGVRSASATANQAGAARAPPAARSASAPANLQMTSAKASGGGSGGGIGGGGGGGGSKRRLPSGSGENGAARQPGAGASAARPAIDGVGPMSSAAASGSALKRSQASAAEAKRSRAGGCGAFEFSGSAAADAKRPRPAACAAPAAASSGAASAPQRQPELSTAKQADKSPDAVMPPPPKPAKPPKSAQTPQPQPIALRPKPDLRHALQAQQPPEQPQKPRPPAPTESQCSHSAPQPDTQARPLMEEIAAQSTASAGAPSSRPSLPEYGMSIEEAEEIQASVAVSRGKRATPSRELRNLALPDRDWNVALPFYTLKAKTREQFYTAPDGTSGGSQEQASHFPSPA